MSMPANHLRPGMVIEYENGLWLCLEAQHRTPGNKRAFMQAKMRNVRDGLQKEFRFSATETIERVSLRERSMQFLYEEGGIYNFMDSENFEQTHLGKENLGEAVHYLLPEAEIKVTFFDDLPIGVALPKTLTFTVVEAEPNMKSATATSSYKTAKVETGLVVKVPQFIETGQRIVVNTETGEYLERAK